MATTSRAALTVEEAEPLVPSSESTPWKSPDKNDAPSGCCTSCGALMSGSESTEPGWQKRQHYDAGIKRAMAAYINSPLMEQLSIEIVVLRKASERLAKERDFWHAKFMDCVRSIGRKRET